MNKFLAIIFVLCFSLLQGSELIEFQGDTIEIFIEKHPSEKAPLLLFFHGAGQDGISDVSPIWFNYWLAKGYSVAAISLRGYGKSSGEKDFCGPLTVKSVHFAIDYIKHQTNPAALGIMGWGQGALAGLLACAERQDISCIVSANCGYNLYANDHLLPLILQEGFALPVSEKELKYRSPTFRVDTITAATFILHRKGNPTVKEKEVLEFYDAMTSSNHECHYSILEKAADKPIRRMTMQEILKNTERWIDQIMFKKL